MMSVPTRPLRILVVDDDPAMVGAITALVGTEGHQVITAYDGLTAVKRFREEHPDLVTPDSPTQRVGGRPGDRFEQEVVDDSRAQHDGPADLLSVLHLRSDLAAPSLDEPRGEWIPEECVGSLVLVRSERCNPERGVRDVADGCVHDTSTGDDHLARDARQLDIATHERTHLHRQVPRERVHRRQRRELALQPWRVQSITLPAAP
jgi:CheY-like chemotaxis protein